MKKGKGSPIATRFTAEEAAMIEELHKRTGLDKSEIIRRCVRLLHLEMKKRGSIGFILDDLEPAGSATYRATLNEPPAKYAK